MNLWSRSQNSDRWKIFRQQNHGHNTLVIDGKLQHAAGKASIVRFSADSDFPHSVADLSAVYENQVESVVRGVGMLPSAEVLVRDRITGLKPGSSVRWGMISPSSTTIQDKTMAILSQGEKTLTLRLLAPEQIAWKIVDTAKPRNDWDSPNRGTVMLAFEASAGADGVLDLAVLATPGSCKDSLAAQLDLKPPMEWE